MVEDRQHQLFQGLCRERSTLATCGPHAQDDVHWHQRYAGHGACQIELMAGAVRLAPAHEQDQAKVQLTTDAHRLCLTAVDNAFWTKIDYLGLHKVYSSESAGRYSPAVCIGCKKLEGFRRAGPESRQHLISRVSEPDDPHVVPPFHPLDERVQQENRNHSSMISLYSINYNFGRVHQTLRVTPAVEAGIAEDGWPIEEIMGLLG